MGDVGIPKQDRVNVRRAIKDAFLDGFHTSGKGNHTIWMCFIK